MPSATAVDSTIRGQRLLPSLLDHLADTEPDRVLYSINKTPNPADGFRDISVRTFANAVNKCAWHLEEQLGGRGEAFPTLTYMGPQDLVYGIIILACIKTGYKVLLNSPRNSLEAHLRLFEQTDCDVFLLPLHFPLPVIKQIQARRKMRVITVPNAQHWLDSGSVPVYPYRKTFEEAKYEPFVVLHTSGSTGWPKPIVQTHGTHAPFDSYPELPSMGFKPVYPTNCTGERLCSAFPLFHCAGVVNLLVAAIYNEVTIVLAPFPPTAEVADAVHTHANVQSSCIPTQVLIELSKDPTTLSNLSRLKSVIFGGGPCPPAVGSLVMTKTHVYTCLGTTECGVPPNHIADPEDWNYLSYSPVFGSDFRHHSGDLYEHFVVRSDKYERFQGIFRTFPNLDEWPMKDLYSKHPTKENVWLYRGRTDDIIVYHTGEKLNPLAMEHTIGSNPAVGAVLVCGQGKFQSSLLVEAAIPPTSEGEKKELLEGIWPSIEAANKEAPSHARIYRDMVLFASAEKPLPKAGKGTVQRAQALDLYRAEIEALYTAAESSTVSESNGVNGFSSQVDDISSAVINLLTTLSSIDAPSVAPDANLFELGLDSLQVTQLAKALNRLLVQKKKPQSIKPRDIYSNPTLGSLTGLVAGLVAGGQIATGSDRVEHKMQALHEQLSSDLPVTVRPIAPQPETQTILLTGSTGSLGGYILEALIRDPSVSQVYCLNRGPDSALRQAAAHASKGLSSSLDKVVALDADLSRSYFGLPVSVYRELLSKVTRVVHNAWQVDFNLDLASFRVHVAGVRRFIDFSAHSHFGAPIFFVSSIGTVSAYDASAAVPEAVLEDWSMSQKTGYGQSKLVSERLLDMASKEAGVPTTIFRVGQIAGPTTKSGIWPRQEWLPSLIASSKHLGMLPDSLGQMHTVDWIPVDLMGRIIVDLSLRASSASPSNSRSDSTRSQGSSVYHLVNPSRTTWSDLLPTVARHLSAASMQPVKTVALDAWVHALRQSAARTDDLAQNPAIKILDFFEDLLTNKTRPVVLDTTDTEKASRALTSVGPVTDTWMENWLRQWALS